eukprot:4545896-Ditylum_brightwellii.AAC.1
MTDKCQTSSEGLNPDKWDQSAGRHGGGPILLRLGGRSRRSKNWPWWCGAFATLVRACLSGFSLLLVMRYLCKRCNGCGSDVNAKKAIVFLEYNVEWSNGGIVWDDVGWFVENVILTLEQWGVVCDSAGCDVVCVHNLVVEPFL